MKESQPSTSANVSVWPHPSSSSLVLPLQLRSVVALMPMMKGEPMTEKENPNTQ